MMRKTTFFIAAFLAALTTLAQQSSIHGTVALFNSQFETGLRLYIANAQVEENFGRSQAGITGPDGAFRLPLIGIRNQEKIFYSVEKEGLEVVNTGVLQAVAGQEEPLRVFMAPIGKIAETKLKYYRINQQAAESALKERLNALEEKIQASQSDQVYLAQLRAEYAQLRAQYERIDDMARQLADRYAYVNLDDAPIFDQQAFRFFQEGKLDSALITLETALPEALLEKKLDEFSRIALLKDEYQTRLAELQQSRRETVASLHFKGNLHYLNFDILLTEKSYELALRLDSSNAEILYDYGFILSKIQKLEMAIQTYSKVATMDLQSDKLVNVNLALARLYLKKNEFIRCEELCLAASSINKAFFTKNMPKYLHNEAQVKIILGDKYFAQNDLARAWKLFLESSKIYESLYDESNDGRYVYEGVQVNQKLGMVLQAQKELARAEMIYISALLTYRGWPADIQEKILPEMAHSILNLGLVQIKSGKYWVGAMTLTSALEKYEQLALRSPQIYQFQLAEVKSHLASAFGAASGFDQAMPLIHEALADFRHYAALNPEAFGSSLISCLLGLGNLFLQQKQPASARTSFSEAKELMYALPEHIQSQNRNLSLDIDHGFARLALLEGDLPVADSLLRLVWEGKNFSTKKPATLAVSQIATLLNDQCELFRKSKDFVQAERHVLKSINLWKGLNREQLYIDRNALIASLQTAGNLYKDWAQFDPSPTINRKWRQLFDILPRFQKNISKGKKWALMTNALQASGKMHSHHDHKSPVEYWLELNVGHSYLLKGKLWKAYEAYYYLKGVKTPEGENYIQICLGDLALFESLNLHREDTRFIRKTLLDLE